MINTKDSNMTKYYFKTLVQGFIAAAGLISWAWLITIDWKIALALFFILLSENINPKQ